MLIKQGDCLEFMKEIPDGSVDMILTDLPYGITDAPFDKRIPFEPMWKEFYRVAKKKAAMALFANGKFLIELAASNLKDYRYKWVWHKNLGTGFLNAKKMPLKCHEDILIFYRTLPTYNPQKWKGKPQRWKNQSPLYVRTDNYRTCVQPRSGYENSAGIYYPRDVIDFAVMFSGAPKYGDKAYTVHPQEKPVDLLEYLIKTYTNEGETVLDATMGSGSTGVAAINTGRDFIGFEKEQNFFEISQKRIAEAQAKKAQELF